MGSFIRCSARETAPEHRREPVRDTGQPIRPRRLCINARANTVTLPFRPSHSSPYIRPWIGMSRGPNGLTSVTVTWEAGEAPPRNQRVAPSRSRRWALMDGSSFRIGSGRAIEAAPPSTRPRVRRAGDGHSEQYGRGARHRLSRAVCPEPSSDKADVRHAAAVANANGAELSPSSAQAPMPCRSLRERSAAQSGCW